MCVLAFAWRAHPRWRLVVAGNRDERHARPSADLGRWPSEDHILAGRDLLSGGSWLGVSEQGRFAVVTNVRGGSMDPAPRSRGALVADFLRGSAGYEELRSENLTQFNAFNLILSDCDETLFLSNRPITSGPLASGIHGLANGALDAPWPKTVRLKASLESWLAADAGDPEKLLESLRDESTNWKKSETLSDADGSPIFIRNPVYGTRCSTVLMIEDSGAGLVVERRFSAEGNPQGETRLPFRWPG